jgi:membrane associated rhomboid family serine protease
MHEIINQLYITVILAQKVLPFALAFIGILYLIFILNKILGNRLSLLSVYPRKLIFTPGIALYSYIHQDFNHIFFNSIPLFVLTILVLLSGLQTFVCVTLTVTLLSGLTIWLLGRPGLHLGASGLIMGYWSYLLMNAYQERTVVSIALAFICIYYFGSLLFHLIPQNVRTSWEAHVYGFFAGLIASLICPSLFCEKFFNFCYQLNQIHI